MSNIEKTIAFSYNPEFSKYTVDMRYRNGDWKVEVSLDDEITYFGYLYEEPDCFTEIMFNVYAGTKSDFIVNCRQMILDKISKFQEELKYQQDKINQEITIVGKLINEI
jgi:hypothetical protein